MRTAKQFLSILGLAVIVLAGISCNRAKQSAKEAINRTGEITGKGASEFVSGVAEGVDETFECQLNISQALEAQGVKHGKYKVEHSDSGENVLTAYLIFDKPFDGTLKAYLYDKNGMEYGRSSQKIRAQAGEARYFDFVFDKRTDIESRSTFRLE